jgi:hypothetical protein
MVLEAPRPEQREAIDRALGVEGDERIEALHDVIRSDPSCLEAWARASDARYEGGHEVAAYAYARVGYHRGLDLLRAAGWRPGAEVHFTDEGDRGFLLSLYGLMRAAAAIGEGVEARRCREFLLQLDPSDPLGVGAIAPKDLSRRLS